MIDMQHIFDILFAIIIATFGWLGKAMNADIKQNTKDLSEHKTHVAENYLKKDSIDEIRDLMQQTNKRVDDIYLLLTNKK